MNLNNANNWSIYKYDLHIITHFSHDVICKNYVDEDMQMQMWLTKCILKNRNFESWKKTLSFQTSKHELGICKSILHK